MRIIILLFIFIGLLKPSTKSRLPVSVEVNGIRSTKGTIHLSAFKTNEQFDKETPVLNFPISKTLISNGSLKTQINLPPGVWGLTLLDDENDNEEMDYSWLRIPEEGFGFSNYYLEGLSKPDIKEFSFNVDSTTSSTIKIKIRYM